MLKRSLALVLVVLLVFSVFPMTAMAAPVNSVSGGGFVIDVIATPYKADSVYMTEGYGALRLDATYGSAPGSATPPKFALIDNSGKEIFGYGKFPCNFSLNSGIFANGVVEGSYGGASYGSYSLFDLTGKQTITKTYDFLSYNDGYGVAYNLEPIPGDPYDGAYYKQTLIDSTGKEILTLPPVLSNLVSDYNINYLFEEAYLPHELLGVIGGYSEGLMWLRTGMPVKNNLSELAGKTDADILEEYYDKLWYGGENTAYIDISGKLVIPQKYDIAYSFSEGLACVEGNLKSTNIDGETYLIGKYGFIDKTGKTVIDFKYANAISFLNGYASVANDSYQYGYIDKTGKEIIPLVYDEAYGAGDGLFSVGEIVGSAVNEWGEEVYTYKFGFVNSRNDVVVPLEYDDVSSFQNGAAYAIKDGNVFILKISGAPSDWAKDYVADAIKVGIVPEELQHSYQSATTRAEFCALAVALYETVTGKEITERAEFIDTKDVNVEKMAALKVVEGVGGGLFEPNSPLTREQAATMLSRLAEAMGKPFPDKESTFADKGSFESWSAARIGQIQAAGIMDGIGNNTFSPKTDYTREQSITTMLRMFNKMK